MVIDEILAVWGFNLDHLLWEIVSEDIGRGFHEVVELIVEGADVKAVNFEGEVAETQLLAFEVLDFVFFSLNFAAVEERDDEAAQQVDSHNGV